MSRTIVCQNTQGSKISFGEDIFSPFVLAFVNGIYNTENAVSMTENTMTDGGTYQGSRSKTRNIVLGVMYRPHIRYAQPLRDVLRELFLKDDLGTFIYTENGVSRKAQYYVEYIRPVEGKPICTVSLKCDDPFFYAEEDITTELAIWQSAFTFPHRFIAEGEPFGYRSTERIAEIINDNAADNIGLRITISAIGNVTNPSIARVESNEEITVGTDAKPLNMVIGDKVIITTGINDKHVYLVHEGIQTEINEYLSEDSEFVQLMRGDNHFGYSAAAGVQNMVVAISYRLKYEGC